MTDHPFNTSAADRPSASSAGLEADPHAKFGATIAGSRWFTGEPATTRQRVHTYVERWPCPVEDCAGEMVFNGASWGTNPPGCHHTCTACGFTAATRGVTYPRTITVPISAALEETK